MRNMYIKLFLSGLLLTIFLTPLAVHGFYESYEAPRTIDLPATFMTTSAVNLRPSPDTNNSRITLVQSGSRVEVTSFGCGEWFAVNVNGTPGYMSSEWLMPWSTATTPVAPGTVELLHWDEARHVMTIGTPATIIDIRTGLAWQVASFSNGNHADVETLTAEDTATMLMAWGGRWSWTPRPVLVIINGRTLAASLNGMPHAGSTRSGNNMNGHVCLHFLGSRTHNGTVSHERDHQAAIQEAYNTTSGSQW